MVTGMDRMNGGMPKTAARVWAVAVSALFFSLAATPLSAQEPPPANIQDGVRDFGSDPDSDGLFEYLVLKVPVNVVRADLYTVKAQLSVRGYTAPVSTAAQKLFLDTGEQAITLTFPGSDLVSMGPNQSLEFRIAVADSQGRMVDARPYPASSAYSGSQFEGFAGMVNPEFTGRVQEVPEDVNADGRFGYLNLTFEVRNLTTAKADVSGTLNRVVPGTGILRSYSAENLTALAELRFDGGSIRDLGQPGPYNVTVRLVLDPGNEVTSDYRTAAYNFSDFEPPRAPVAFTGNGTDAGTDQNGDGLFDQLQVQVEVAIALEGAYTFRAALQLPERYRMVQELVPRPSVSLDFSQKGTYTVAFNFSGPVLRMLQLDGPYNASLDAFSERVLFVANGTYATKGYLSTQFASPRLLARFSGTASVEAVDNDQNGLFDVLKVTVPVEVASAGSYQLAGAVYAGGRFVTWSGGQLELGTGQGKVSMKFRGQDIGQSGFDGPYTIVLFLGGKAGDGSGIGAYLPPDRLEVQTKELRAVEFEKRAVSKKPLPLPVYPEVNICEDSNKVRAPGITAEVNRSAPDISYYYTLDDGRSARFRLVFTQLIAYTDTNANGVYDPGEERFQGLLSLANWEASTVAFTGEQGGRILRYNLTAVLDLSAVGRQAGAGAPQARVPQWGRMTFSFTIASRDVIFSRPLAFSLRGGTEMKIDILIEPGRDLPGGVTGLALQHFLSDESGRNYFKTFESDQTRIFKPGSAGANTTIFRSGLAALQKIGLAGGSGGKEHGYYSWLPQVLVGNLDGSSSYMPVNLTYSTDGRQMALALNYPLPEGTASLLHDPTVGVNATNAPVLAITIPKILFNPLFYVVAIGIAVAVIAVIRRSQRNGE